MFHVPFFRLQMTQKVFEKEGSPGRPWHAMAITWLTCWPVALYCKRTLHNVTIPPSQSPPDPVSWCILWLQVHVDVTIPPPSLPRMRLFESDTSRFLALAKQDPGCWCSKVTLRPWLTSGFKDVKRERERECIIFSDKPRILLQLLGKLWLAFLPFVLTCYCKQNWNLWWPWCARKAEDMDETRSIETTPMRAVSMELESSDSAPCRAIFGWSNPLCTVGCNFLCTALGGLRPWLGHLFKIKHVLVVFGCGFLAARA